MLFWFVCGVFSLSAWSTLLCAHVPFLPMRQGKLTMLDMFEGEGATRAPGDLNFGKRFLPADKAAADEMATKDGWRAGLMLEPGACLAGCGSKIGTQHGLPW